MEARKTGTEMKKPSAKDIVLRPISGKEAAEVVRQNHYSGKPVQNSQFHIGVYLEGSLEGAMSFGPSLDKRNIMQLVEGTEWNEFLELNRMAFSEALPRNSESRAIAIAMKILKKHAPKLKWIVSFADGTRCGDGTIYRASGFVLTGIKKNTTLGEYEGKIVSNLSFHVGKHALKSKGKAGVPDGFKPLDGFQLRYIYFLDESYRDRLTVDELPFSTIDEMGAGMYLGNAKKEQAKA